MTTMLGNGVYTCSEAARLTGLKKARIREWFREESAKSNGPPRFRSDYEPVEGDLAISFLDLIDVFVAGHLREHGLSLQTLRGVYARLAKELSSGHPFGRQEMLSDGKGLFTQGMDVKGGEERKEVLTRQKVFQRVILPFLKTIDYGPESKLAERWHIAPGVVLDPRICFGTPIVEAVSVPTAILAAAYRANDEDAEAVASWYNVHANHVIAAVQFESKMAA